jgi:hypothetical protein
MGEMTMINPDAYTVLCFGDSFTHGMPSDDDTYARLAADVRWAGRLQLLFRPRGAVRRRRDGRPGR